MLGATKSPLLRGFKSPKYNCWFKSVTRIGLMLLSDMQMIEILLTGSYQPEPAVWAVVIGLFGHFHAKD